MSESNAPLLRLENVNIEFATPTGPFSAVRDFNLVLNRGRKLAIVGESGSGKSTVAASIMGLLAPNGQVSTGRVLFQGCDITALPESELRKIRGALIGRVPQDPMTNLNPLMRIGKQLCEVLEVHGLKKGKAAQAAVLELMAMVGLKDPERCFNQYPHEMSGGMRQRVLIAMGLACQPKLLIADEPTSALDVTVQKVILDELDRMTEKLGAALILVTHDLLMAAERADDILVMYRGDEVESGPAADVLSNPQHEYTKRLLDAAPTLNSKKLIPVSLETNAEPLRNQKSDDLVEFIGVTKAYGGLDKWFAAGKPFFAVNNSSFTIPRGQTIAVVGESGSGKSTTAKLLLKLETTTRGEILFDGKKINDLSGSQLKAFRKRVQPVFQNPYSSLDARYTVRQSIEEPLVLHGWKDPVERRAIVDDLLEKVALPISLAHKYPTEISGGQSQRVAIARALAVSPELIVLDEAVSALDVLVQEQILELLCKLQAELGLSYLFISHDLAVVRMIAHQIHVMQGGQIVESGTPDEIFNNPQNPYTRELIAAIPTGTRNVKPRNESNAVPHLSEDDLGVRDAV